MTEQKTPEQWKEEQQQAIRQMQDAARRCLNMAKLVNLKLDWGISRYSVWGKNHQFPPK